MVNKISLYYNTIKYMKISQIYYRVKKILGLSCSLSYKPKLFHGYTNSVANIRELDFDGVFLNRFNVNDLMQDNVAFLYSSEKFTWNKKWYFNDKSPLWNFNLHYFEYLFPLLEHFHSSNDRRFLDKCIFIIKNWIEYNPQKSGGAGWAPYTIALRLTNWISFYTYIENEIDDEFKTLFTKSIHEQYVYLSCHLEKDLLGNHYFEDLKALILSSLFFGDEKMLGCVLKEFKKECNEQILNDGMHFELSPMYHKLIFEDMIRIAYALRVSGKADHEIESYLQSMLDVAWSLEEGLERIPLFNDCGNNVAKSLDSLVESCEQYFGLRPKFKTKFESSGYYIFQKGDWKLIVDAGQPGADYIPGHAHCDAMSFELFKAGKPVIVNCGTYAYQCKERSFFRSTAAHNTVMINGEEQSQCWGAFRLAKRCSVKVVDVTGNSIVMQMTDQKGKVVTRNIMLGDELVVKDKAIGNNLTGYIHLLEDLKYRVKGSNEYIDYLYAYDYGNKRLISTIKYKNQEMISLYIAL